MAAFGPPSRGCRPSDVVAVIGEFQPGEELVYFQQRVEEFDSSAGAQAGAPPRLIGFLIRRPRYDRSGVGAFFQEVTPACFPFDELALPDCGCIQGPHPSARLVDGLEFCVRLPSGLAC